MTDIRIGVRQGDTSGVDLLKDMGDEVGRSSVKWGEMANAAKAAAKAVYDFARDSLKAYAESERVQRQLTRAAGEYSDALADQAEAMSKLYAVDDDVIKQSQTLLAQWGGAGAAAEDVTKAVLDYAAAMGVDAKTATQDLIRNVESGGVGLAKLGVHFTATGNKGKDLAAAVEALGKKFGGAAQSDAESLIGRTHAATLAFEDMQKSLGGMLATALDKSGALEWLTKRIREVTRGFEILFALGQRLPGMVGGVLRGDIKPDLALAELKSTAIGAWFGGKKGETPGALPDVTGSTNKAMRAAAGAGPGADATGAFRDWLKEQEAWQDEQAAKEQADYAHQLEMSAKRVDADLKEAKDRQDVRRDMLLQIEKDNAASAERQAKTEQRMMEEAAKRQEEALKHKAAQARQAGDAIGAAFVNALSEQLAKLAEGGEFDAAVFVGDILASVVSVAAAAIGSAYGMPALGAAVGNIAGMGIRAGASSLSANAKKAKAMKQYHSGGWVGPDEVGHLPRYHSGAWIGADEQMAVLQTGERVLSGREVAAAGGRGAVDAMARGGAGRVVVNIQAIDSKSAAESFERDLAEGMRKAQLAGRGMLPALLGAGPR